MRGGCGIGVWAIGVVGVLGREGVLVVAGVRLAAAGAVLGEMWHLLQVHVLWCCLTLVSVVHVVWIHSLQELHWTDPRVRLVLVIWHWQTGQV